MAWNGSDSRAEVPAGNENKTVNRSSFTRGKSVLVWPLIVVGCAVAIWFAMSGDETPSLEADANSTHYLADMGTNIVAAAVPTERVKPIDPTARPTKVGEVVNGYVLLPSGRLHKRTGVITNSIAMRPKGRWEIFDRKCNNDIAAYLTIRPGGMILGSLNYNGRFKKDFLESIKEPILIADNDTPEVKQLKKDVISARMELKDALDRGEDIEQIMMDTRKDLQRLMQINNDIRKLFFEEKNKCQTDEEVEDLFNSCNKILEEKGIAPLKYGPITRRNLARQKNDFENK